jgi:hypothetical protein
MAVNKPVGDKAGKGAVKKRTQCKTAVLGQTGLDQARQDTGRIMAVKHVGRISVVIRRVANRRKYAWLLRPTSSLEFAACASVRC